MPTLSTVLLTIKGDARKANLTLDSNNSISIDTIQKYFKKKDEPEQVASYEYEEKQIYLFGYKKGKKGTENKSELPAPHDSVTLYGDILIVASIHNSWGSPIPFTVDQWDKFYNSFDDIDKDTDGDDDDDDDDEDEEDIVSEQASVKSNSEFGDDEDISDESDISSDEDVPEPEPIVKKRKAPAYGNSKVDTNILKEEIPITSPPDTSKVRKACIGALDFLKEDFTEGEIVELEKAIFESAWNTALKYYVPRNWKSVQFCEIYRETVRSVICNIHPDSPVGNTRLLKRIKDGEFTLTAIPTMSPYEMYPERWMELADKQLVREQKILEGNKSRATDQFKCRRCQKRECVYYEMQTRSADEPMTIFITCLNCGKRWRQGG